MLPPMRRITHFSGVHRSGKTTSAQRFALENDQIFIPTNFQNITNIKGFSAKGDVVVQENLIDRMRNIYLKILRYNTRKYIVLDRSILDIFAYSLYYKLPEKHIKYMWYSIENIFDLLFTNNNIPIHENFDYPLLDHVKPDEANEYKKLLECFQVTRHLFHNYAQKKAYYV